MPNPTQYLSYDATGNRNDSVCDNLNRAASIGGVACANDILGNRTLKGSVKMEWDALNRMVYMGPADHTAPNTFYTYRADGMRVQKNHNEPSDAYITKYRYDGQMGIEDEEYHGSPSGYSNTVTRYGLGARGIDLIETYSSTNGAGGTTVVSYPIYDAHGNMVATVSRSGTNDCAISNQRSFDAWGNVRIGSTSGNPTGRYCANIGHKQDDESGLVYMRARYYEPTSGRFVSQDTLMQGVNWFIFCNNDPIQLVDESGNSPDIQTLTNALLVASLLASLVACARLAHTAAVVAVAGMVMLSLWFFGKYLDGNEASSEDRKLMGGGLYLVTHELFVESNMLLKEACASPAQASGIETKTLATFGAYAIIVSLFMLLDLNIG